MGVCGVFRNNMPMPASIAAAGDFESETLRVALPDPGENVGNLRIAHFEQAQCRATGLQRRLERFSDLIVDASTDQLTRMLAIESTHQQLGLRKLGAHQLDDAIGGRTVLDADRDLARLAGAGRSQYIEACAIAVVHSETELLSGADHLDIRSR